MYGFDYPQDWIGIPHFGEGEVFATPEAWASALAAELTEGLGFFSGRQKRFAALAEAFASVARRLEVGGSHWGFIWLASFDGPLHVVATQALARGGIDGVSAAELAGADAEGDPTPPVVREIVAAAGAPGVYVERRALLDDEAARTQVLIGSYAFETPEAIVLLQASTTDVAGYELFRPHYEEFARTFLWVASDAE